MELADSWALGAVLMTIRRAGTSVPTRTQRTLVFRRDGIRWALVTLLPGSTPTGVPDTTRSYPPGVAYQQAVVPRSLPRLQGRSARRWWPAAVAERPGPGEPCAGGVRWRGEDVEATGTWQVIRPPRSRPGRKAR